MTLLGLRDGEPAYVIADSEIGEDEIGGGYATATGAVSSGDVRSGVETVEGDRVGESAFPVDGLAPGREEAGRGGAGVGDRALDSRSTTSRPALR